MSKLPSQKEIRKSHLEVLNRAQERIGNSVLMSLWAGLFEILSASKYSIPNYFKELIWPRKLLFIWGLVNMQKKSE